MILAIDFRAPRLGRFWPAVKQPAVTLAGVTSHEDSAMGILDLATRGRRVCVVIHGYNSPDSSVDPAYHDLAHQMELAGLYDPSHPDAPYESLLFVKWPGGWEGGYPIAEWRAYGKFGIPGAGDRLHDVLAKLEPATLDVQAHSLGNGVMLDANRKGDLPIRNMIMAAPAVDNDWICVGARFCTAVSSIRGKALVFHSKHDSALKAFEFVKFDRALGYTGPVPEFPACAIAVDANPWSASHSAFRGRPEFYAAWLGLVAPRSEVQRA